MVLSIAPDKSPDDSNEQSLSDLSKTLPFILFTTTASATHTHVQQDLTPGACAPLTAPAVSQHVRSHEEETTLRCASPEASLSLAL